jgi:hypothetical protein
MVSRNIKEVTVSTFQTDFIQCLSMSSHDKSLSGKEGNLIAFIELL